MGRPSTYKPEFNKQVEKLSLLGLIDKEMADFFEISEVTFNAWKKANPEFLKSIKRGKAIADAEVVKKLYERANGYSFEEKTYEKDEITGKMVLTKRVKKHMAPDTGAQCFWLKNRQPDKWRDKHEVDAVIKSDMSFTLDID